MGKDSKELFEWAPKSYWSGLQRVNNLTPPLVREIRRRRRRENFGVFWDVFPDFLCIFAVWRGVRGEIMCGEGALDVKRPFLALLAGRGAQEGWNSTLNVS